MARPVVVVKVAARYQAGLLYPPPAMFRDIYDWVLAVVAATAIEKFGDRGEPDFERYDQVLKAAEEYRANPTNWKLYVALYEAMWIFGHPGGRVNVKEFQKMTPEKRTALTERSERLYKHVHDYVQRTKDSVAQSQAKDEAANAKLRMYLIPGVSAITGSEVEREFPIDLTGWKYGNEELLQRVDAIAKKEVSDAQELYDDLDQRPAKPDFVDYKREILEGLKKQIERGGWKSIHVILTQADLKGCKAYWQAGTRRIVISVPYDSNPSTLTDLASTLRHEMQHFSQSYLSYTLGKLEGAGLPSRDIRTPEYKQWMSPTHPSFKPDEARTRQLLQRLKQEGILPRQVNFHDLDDVEFYTELVDAIDEFKGIWSRHSKGSLNIAIKLFTGVMPQPDSHAKDWYQQTEALGGYDFISPFRPNKSFLAWKARAPGKFQKALKEFVSAVGQSG